MLKSVTNAGERDATQNPGIDYCLWKACNCPMRSLVKPLRSLAMRPVKWILRRNDRMIVNRNFYGLDFAVDIQRLSDAWRHPIEIFFDVGANEGQTLVRAREHFEACEILAFEPHPITFAALAENTKDIPRVRLHNVALGSEVGEKIMFEFGHSTISSLLPDGQYIVMTNRQPSSQINVDCTTVGDFCAAQAIDKIDVLKIDTEGSELEVLKGAVPLLKNGSIKFIYFEFTSISPLRGMSGGALGPIDELLTSHGYRFVATYNDYILPDTNLFNVSNALYAVP